MTGRCASIPDVPVVHLLSGLPGSGKPTLARQLADTGAVRLSVDDEMLRRFGRIGEDYPLEDHLRLLPTAIEAIRSLLADTVATGRDVVLDHGLGRRAERDEWKAFIVTLGASWRLHATEASHEELVRRLEARRDGGEAVPDIEPMLAFMARTSESPDGEGEEY